MFSQPAKFSGAVSVKGGSMVINVMEVDCGKSEILEPRLEGLQRCDRHLSDFGAGQATPPFHIRRHMVWVC
jgi:hypothetical protein